MLWLIFLLLILSLAFCETRHYEFDLKYSIIDVDGAQAKQVITVNGEWPAPIIRLKRGDRALIKVTNHLDEDSSIHFHGIFQTNSTHMDGAAMITQCGIPPGQEFTYDFVVDQVGTYWYHSHSAGQYADGLRGLFIIDDPNPPFQYDYDVGLSVSDWYHKTAPELIAEAKFARGSEPNIDSCLFNETTNMQWKVEPGSTYYLHVANIGMSAPQYLYMEDHNMTIVEIDGVYVEPVEVESLYIVSGQRYGLLLKTKPSVKKNYRFVQILQKMMSVVVQENWLVYDSESPLTSDLKIKDKKKLNYIDDITLIPLDKVPAYKEADKSIHLEFAMENGHYSFNHHPFESPEVPTLYSVLSAPDDIMAAEVSTYHNASNPYIIEKDDIVEVIVDSKHDMMRHPFHLHGHNFQVVYRGKNIEEMQIPQYPMIRDTINLLGHSKVVIRFKADNPGVWFFHCHIDWHLIQGLAVTIIEDVQSIRKSIEISDQFFSPCAAATFAPPHTHILKLSRFEWIATVVLLTSILASAIFFTRMRVTATFYKKLTQSSFEMDGI